MLQNGRNRFGSLLICLLAVSVSCVGFSPQLRTATIIEEDGARSGSAQTTCCCGTQQHTCCGMACCNAQSPDQNRSPVSGDLQRAPLNPWHVGLSRVSFPRRNGSPWSGNRIFGIASESTIPSLQSQHVRLQV